MNDAIDDAQREVLESTRDVLQYGVDQINEELGETDQA